MASETVEPLKRYVHRTNIADSIYGKIIKAYDSVSAKWVIIKLSNTELVRQSISRTCQRVHENVLREAKVLAGIPDHPGVVKLLDVHEEVTQPLHWMVLEYVESMELFQYVEKRGPVAKEIMVGWIQQMVEGLQHVHRSGFAHLDVSLENYLLTKEGRLVLCDFGASLPIEEDGCVTVPNPNLVPGKSNYAAPELYKYEKHNAEKLDVFSLGITIFAALTQGNPIQSAHHSDRNWRILDEEGVPEEWLKDDLARDMISKMILSDPERRSTFQDVLEHPFVTAE